MAVAAGVPAREVPQSGGFFGGFDVVFELLAQFTRAGGEFLRALFEDSPASTEASASSLRLAFSSPSRLGGGFEEALAVGFEDVKLVGLLLGFLRVLLEFIEHFLKTFGRFFEFLLGVTMLRTSCGLRDLWR
jgi:hypothetical protein